MTNFQSVLAFIPYQPAATYMSLTLTTLGYSVFEANMLAIPGYFLFFLNVSICSCYSIDLVLMETAAPYCCVAE